MIIWLQYDVPVGTKSEYIYDYDKIKHNQPSIIVRKATKEEYIEQYLSERGKLDGPLSDLDGLFFYEVSTD